MFINFIYIVCAKSLQSVDLWASFCKTVLFFSLTT